MHVRQQIREYVVAELTGLATTGTKVYPSRVLPVPNELMPCLCVYLGKESGSENDVPLNCSGRTLEVVIDAYVSGQDADDTLNEISAEIETALFAVPAMGGLTRGIYFRSMATVYPADAAKPFGIQRNIFAVEYVIEDGDPENAV